MVPTLRERHLDDKPYIEIVDGCLFEKVSPKRAHAIVQVAAVGVLQRCAGRSGDVLTELRVYLAADTTLVPDVSYVSYDRLRVLDEESRERLPFSPDVVIEVRSLGDGAGRIRKKTKLYLAHGALAVLNVDPKTRTVTLDDANGARAFQSSDRVTCDAVPWLEFDAADLFAGLDIPE